MSNNKNEQKINHNESLSCQLTSSLKTGKEQETILLVHHEEDQGMLEREMDERERAARGN